MLIDFKEIPPANSSDGSQDTWEKFSRDFLETLGYIIISEPTRGPDGGLDIKVKEVRKGISNITDVYWLASCKHYAHSNRSITTDIEIDIRDRVETHGCTGFIGLYSTIASTPLRTKLQGLNNKIEYQIFDNEKIESRIVGHFSKENLFLRYFPLSYIKWKEMYFFREPVKLFQSYFEFKYDRYIDLFEQISGRLENMIKGVRVSNSFTELLKQQDIECIIFPNLVYTVFGNYEFKHKKVDKLTLQMLWEDLVPAEIEHLFEIKINPNIILLSSNTEKEAQYMLYPNHLVYDQNYQRIFSDMFNDLKEVLN